MATRPGIWQQRLRLRWPPAGERSPRAGTVKGIETRSESRRRPPRGGGVPAIPVGHRQRGVAAAASGIIAGRRRAPQTLTSSPGRIATPAAAVVGRRCTAGIIIAGSRNRRVGREGCAPWPRRWRAPVGLSTTAGRTASGGREGGTRTAVMAAAAASRHDDRGAEGLGIGTRARGSGPGAPDTSRCQSTAVSDLAAADGPAAACGTPPAGAAHRGRPASVHCPSTTIVAPARRGRHVACRLTTCPAGAARRGQPARGRQSTRPVGAARRDRPAAADRLTMTIVAPDPNRGQRALSLMGPAGAARRDRLAAAYHLRGQGALSLMHPAGAARRG